MRPGRAVAALAAAILIVGCTSATAVPLPNPDPCAITGTLTDAKHQAYDRCRFDRLELAIPGNQTVTVTAPPVTVTATVTAPTSTVTVTATPTSSAPATTTAPTTTTPQNPPAAWPGPTNTGVPAGTNLTPYTGEKRSDGACPIFQDGTVIDGKTLDCDVAVFARDVVIKNSKVTGLVVLDADRQGSGAWSVTVQDSEVNGGQQQRAVVSSGNLTVLRSNIYGGITGVQCDENSIQCLVQDSWVHGQYMLPGSDWHLGGILSNGTKNLTIRHNSVTCDAGGGGCTGDINLIPNFAAIDGALIEGNLFKASVNGAYCTYGGEKGTSPTPNSKNVVYKNNVFERGPNGKCAVYGPVTGFGQDPVKNPGNQWIGNTWDDGAPVDPAN